MNEVEHTERQKRIIRDRMKECARKEKEKCVVRNITQK